MTDRELAEKALSIIRTHAAAIAAALRQQTKHADKKMSHAAFVALWELQDYCWHEDACDAESGPCVFGEPVAAEPEQPCTDYCTGYCAGPDCIGHGPKSCADGFAATWSCWEHNPKETR